MWEWIQGTLEYQHWGWNSLIIGSAGTIIFTFFEGWGILKQNESIWREKSGESVSVSWFSFLGFFFFAFILYGVHLKSIAIVVNGSVLGPLHLPVLWGLWKYKGFTGKEKLLFVLSVLMVPAMAFIPWKSEVYLLLSIGTIIALASQPWEIWENKNAGVLEIRLIGIYLVSTGFWVAYAFATGDLPLEIITTAALFLLLITCLLWFKYRK